MAVAAINSVIENMQALAAQASGGIQPPAFSRGDALQNKTEVNFSDLLMNSVKSLNEVRNHASMQTEKFMLGAPDVSLNDVMVDMQKSSLALNLGVQVRNKLVSAYQEVMSMPV
ncbi:MULTISPECIES: flagellar hook-basal body complex protein FliE [Tenebrionibacter/Tenebrionicola group]|jgi:flagellar hook-basal body complex protein FliE|uniref:Flagellar hook-basal body complex protein FliE n=2 Tax=Tenebrionibacter/Tenebrionicola group TaxID=2969848 RepID=A0A8K0V6K0_9ENTR|nr:MULTISPECIES: flagellar hook-basal body complex protein FliE [Tenebrionibacter/Tenebrionicola group]MBK4716721.1 flagellar hook-basal body complex protein FliE [Tenebrionibacter intestinalis]MBV4413995.1 flagellar hook-basal body complex protein FliE [Tenebrionicola larvae]MBV5096208.1 flagellar hook-basal body complex protein FliE [Tenebrionicola larvae]